MRIGIFLQNLNSGGAEKIMIGFANYLVNNTQDEVYLIVVKYTGSYTDFIDSRIKVINLKKKKVLYSFFALISALKRLELDCLYSTLVNANILALLACKYLSQKIIIREANTISEDRKYEPRLLIRVANHLTRYLYLWTYKCIAISENVKNDLICYTNCPKYKIEVIYNPIIIIDNETAKLDKTLFHVAFVSRITTQKNVDAICSLITEIMSVECRIVFHFFGEGDSDALTELIKNFGREKVILHGFNISYFSYVKQMDLFIHIPLWEGLGNSVLEVFNSGIPMILSDINSGYAELILKSYDNVHYFPPHAISLMKQCILDYYSGKIVIKKGRPKLNLTEKDIYIKYRNLANK